MRVKGVIAEDFVNYNLPAMFIISSFCNWKCCKEQGLDVRICQNNSIAAQPIQEIADDVICKRYLSNDITKAIVIGGLEPFEQFSELCELLATLRNEFKCNDDVVIYTGYYPEEIESEIEFLKFFGNIIVKFGRYIPNRPHRYDEVLGVELVSDNQYAKRIC